MANTEAPQGASVIERPLCKCHGELMSWHPDKRKSASGYWRCTIHRRELNRGDYQRHRDARRKKIEEYKAAHHDRYLAYWRERYRTKKGWYEEGGMATKSTQFKELTNG